MRAPWDAAELRATIDECLRRAPRSVGAPTTWVLSNHDVTRHATRYGRLDSTGGGVSDEDRVGPDTPLDPALGLRRARAATLLMLALPGSAYVYQGEELGLPEVVDLPEDVLADPIWERSGHTRAGPRRLPGADPVDTRRPVARLRGRRALAAAAGGAGPSCPSRREQGVEGSTLELYRSALRAPSGPLTVAQPSTGCPRPRGR